MVKQRLFVSDAEGGTDMNGEACEIPTVVLSTADTTVGEGSSVTPPFYDKETQAQSTNT